MKAFGGFAAAVVALGAHAALAISPALLARAPQEVSTAPSVTATSNSGSQYGYAPPRQSSGSSGTAQSASVGFGDFQCGNSMCVEALVNGTNVQYTLTSKRATAGWMAMGFGSRMANSPMVIMWANADGSLTLSQRSAPGQTEPTVVAAPPRVATAQRGLSITSGSNPPKFVYTIPANAGETRQTIIYAFGTRAPTSASPDAALAQHVDRGVLQLDLTKQLTGSTGTGASPSGTAAASDDGIPLSSREKMIVAHGILAAIGFVFFLPIGALIPRYARTFVAGPTWFKTHWIVQAVFAGTAIVIGCSLGFAAVSQRGGEHLDSAHKRLGTVLFAIYFLQVGIGAFIHFVKPKTPRKRPAQNYFHVFFGLLIIALAMAQVRTGFAREWTRATGRTDVANGIYYIWYIWVILLPIAYGAGLVFLKKQYAQEATLRKAQ